MSDNVRLQAWQLQNLLRAFVQNAAAHPGDLQLGPAIEKSQELIEVLHHDLNLDQFKRRKLKSSKTVRQFQNRVAKVQVKCRKLKTERDLIKGQKLAGRVQHVWCIRAGLAPPNISPQSLSELCKDFGIVEDKVLSRTYVTQVRDAFSEIIKRGNLAELGLETTKISRSSLGTSQAIIVSHLHDEATLKLRSYDSDITGRTLRARYSKVQNEVVHVRFPTSNTLEFLTELKPLLKKDSDTIGQSLVNTAKDLLSACLQQESQAWETLRIIYILTGDGINTNLASARKMYSFFLQNKYIKGTRLDFSLWNVRCASHVANLVVLVALVGEIIPSPVDNSDLCANLVRWYKYIIPSYVEELNSSLRTFVLNQFRVRVGDPDDVNIPEPNLRQCSLGLQRLYGPDTVPEELLQVFNRGLGVWLHVSAEDGQQQLCVQKAFRLISNLVLFLQERPQPTRFWHFAACTRALLRMRLIGITKGILTVSTTSPSAENADRISKFWHYYDSAGTDQKLRTAVLCLSLTEHALNISSSKMKDDEGREPTLVRLAKGEVQAKTLDQLDTILGLLHLDTSLDIIDTTVSLLVTEIHLLVRYDEYFQFPYRVYELTRRFNPLGHVACIESFLDLPPAALDAGYSAKLQQEAWKQGPGGGRELSSAIAFLLRDDIQMEMTNALEHASASSLDVERSHVQVKRNEQNKVLSVAVASRNRILARQDRFSVIFHVLNPLIP